MPDSSAIAGFEATNPASYVVWRRDIIRWGDLDSMGHVNNAMFSRFFESGRIALLDGFGQQSALAPDNVVLAHISIDFLNELHFPGEVQTGLRVLSLGRSSFTVAEAIFQNDQCAATASAVMVFIDLETRQSTPLPDSVRQLLLPEN